MSNIEKVNILKYFLLCETLTPKQADKPTPKRVDKQSKVVINTEKSIFTRHMQDAFYRLDNNKIITFALFGSLYPTKNIQKKLKNSLMPIRQTKKTDKVLALR
ncbi:MULTISPECIES: hypothetical protein [Campylobacter]|uniref:hypothetical protein n=1 Tax=Campylobacter TaxID=194 RepID=UPI000A33EE26|nr:MULTISPECIES: hypothetical protein [unclassified Campylobacter]